MFFAILVEYSFSLYLIPFCCILITVGQIGPAARGSAKRRWSKVGFKGASQRAKRARATLNARALRRAPAAVGFTRKDRPGGEGTLEEVLKQMPKSGEPKRFGRLCSRSSRRGEAKRRRVREIHP